MSTLETFPCSDHVDYRAARVGQARRDRQREDRAYESLMPLVRRLARYVAFRLTKQGREDLVESAPGEIWERMRRFPAEGRFVPWCHKTLHHWMVDELKKQTTRARHEREAARQRPEAGYLQGPLAVALFPERVLLEMDRWPPRQRLVWLCLGDLRGLVAQDRWERWVETCNVDRDDPLPVPFPPAEWEDSQDGRERVDLLAALFQVEPGTIAQWVCRCRRRADSIAAGN